MDLLRSLAASAPKRTVDGAAASGAAKFRRRGDAEAEREARYRAEQREREAQHEAKLAAQRAAREAEEARLRRSDRAAPVTAEQQEAAAARAAARAAADAVKRALRGLGEPATLFGETDADRERRLLNVDSRRREVEERGGQDNEFLGDLKRSAAGQLAALAGGVAGSGAAAGAGAASAVAVSADTAATLAEVEAAASVAAAALRAPDDDEVIMAGKHDAEREPCWFALAFILNTLREWDSVLAGADLDTKATSAYKDEVAVVMKTRRDLAPLLRLLKKKRLAQFILHLLVRIVRALERRDYLEANTAYYDLSIGRDPWSIGVTMVGIHARKAREKIGQSEILHVMNDETQRKYIQSLRRVITFYEKRYPHADSSLNVF